MYDEDILEKLEAHVRSVPYEIDKKYFNMAIEAIKHLQGIIKEHTIENIN